jgi:lipoprotein LpqH
VKRGLAVAGASAAVLVVGLSGCSSDKPSSGGSSPSGTTSVSAGGAGGPTKVIIDGKEQNIASGTTNCTSMGGTISIMIGGASTGIAAVLGTGNPPEVKSVGLGSVNGVVLAYAAGTGQGNASATKNGNSYKITGTATGIDAANPMTPVSKSFEIDATCA